MQTEIIESLRTIDAAAWNRLDRSQHPFSRHEFLSALEESGSVGPGSGWLSRHLVLRDDQGVRAAMPLYEKHHSYGEYVFDWAWADAYTRTGLRYYPKLVNAIPFSPVNGPRLLTGTDTTLARRLLQSALDFAATDYSSLHTLFCTEDELPVLQAQGMLIREGIQFHWRNRNYPDFEAFLSDFSSRKRKQVKKERREAMALGLEIECLQGREIRTAHWDALYDFYLDTVSKKGAIPYLKRTFFYLLGEKMADACVLFLARDHRRHVAGAFNLRSETALYGRYWGAVEDYPALHFELCYYQGIDYCLREKLDLYESGAQGEHKLARGFLPTLTYSAHWIDDRRFRAAIADFLAREREGVRQYQADLMQSSPFRVEA